MEQGFSKEAVAGELGVHVDTIYEWVKVYPEFSEAIKLGEAKSRMYWERLGIDYVVGMTGAGSIKINPSVWIFNMKNRFGWRDTKDVPDNPVEDNLKTLSDNELEKLLKDLKPKNS